MCAAMHMSSRGRMAKDAWCAKTNASCLPVSSQVTGPIDSVSQSTIENLVDLSQVETTLPKPEPWQVWWSLFFDLPLETTR